MNEIKKEKQYPKRSPLQNRSEHKYFGEVANALVENGITLQVFIQNLEVDPTKDNVKDVFRAIARAKFKKDSTADLTTKETIETFEELNRHLATLGIHVPWPSMEELSFKNYDERRL